MSDAFPINEDFDANDVPVKTGNHNIGAMHNNIVKDKNLTAKVLALNLKAYHLGDTKARTAVELQNRFDDYLLLCANAGLPPTVEGLVLISGYSRTAFWEIAQGLNHPELVNTVKRAKDYIQNYDATMATMNKVNAAVYCFRAKNFYDMKDVQEIQAGPIQDPTKPTNASDILNALPETPISASDIPTNAEEN